MERVLPALPLVSVVGIAAVVVVIVASSADTITSVGFVVVLAVVPHHGLDSGSLSGRLVGAAGSH